MKLLVTGSTGFVGHTLIDEVLKVPDYHVCAAVRGLVADLPKNVEQFEIKGISPDTDWEAGLEQVDCIIHIAARVHIMSDTADNPLEEFRIVNTHGTLALAKQAEKSGVKRFIYLSTIKVNGESTRLDTPFKEDDIFIPTDPYALSKYEAEIGLLDLAKTTKMEVVIIRPPLVYGPGVKANFYSMMKWLNKEIPLPFGAIHNKRNLVALDNLVDLILTCIEHPAAANQIFLVSDGEDLSTTELLSCVAKALGKKLRLLRVNQQLLELGLKFVGKKGLAQRLCGSLQVDISKAKKLLNWTPPVSVDEGLRKTAQHFLELQSK